jgi:hypothetical protein
MINDIQQAIDEKHAKEEKDAQEARINAVSLASKELMQVLRKHALSLREASFAINSCQKVIDSHMSALPLTEILKNYVD